MSSFQFVRDDVHNSIPSDSSTQWSVAMVIIPIVTFSKFNDIMSSLQVGRDDVHNSIPAVSSNQRGVSMG